MFENIVFLLLGVAITAGTILFYKWLLKEFPKDMAKINSTIENKIIEEKKNV